MIVRVKARIGRLGCSPTHNAPGTPVACAWCRDRVFKVVATLSGWQQTLPVAKNNAIFGVAKRTTRMNQPVDLHRLLRQIGYRDDNCLIGGTRSLGLHQRSRKTCQKRNTSEC